MSQTLDGYQAAARKFGCNKLELPTDLYLAVMALGVAGEAGEVADLVKKTLGHKHPPDREKMVKELGDVLWYVSEIAGIHGVSLWEVATANLTKLQARYPAGFSTAASLNRIAEDK